MLPVADACRRVPLPREAAKAFRPEGGKKALKERMSGQVYSMDDDGDATMNEPEIDNFALGIDSDENE